MRTVAVVIAASLLTGCGDAVDLVPAKPKPQVLVFDPKNAETSIQWLIQKAVGFQDEAKSVAPKPTTNPLRKVDDRRYQAVLEDWEVFLKTLTGKEVVWPAVVARITPYIVQVDCVPKQIDEDGIKVKALFDQYPVGLRDHSSGTLFIGSSISLKDAETLEEGTKLLVRGRIEKIEGSIFPRHAMDDSYINIYISETRAILP